MCPTLWGAKGIAFSVMASGSCCLRWRHGHPHDWCRWGASQHEFLWTQAPLHFWTGRDASVPAAAMPWNIWRRVFHSAAPWQAGWMLQSRLCLRSPPLSVPLSRKKENGCWSLTGFLPASPPHVPWLLGQAVRPQKGLIPSKCFSMCSPQHWLLRGPVLRPSTATGANNARGLG